MVPLWTIPFESPARALAPKVKAYADAVTSHAEELRRATVALHDEFANGDATALPKFKAAVAKSVDKLEKALA